MADEIVQAPTPIRTPEQVAYDIEKAREDDKRSPREKLGREPLYPTSFTAERRDQVVNAIMAGGSISLAAAAAGVGNDTLRNWMMIGAEEAAAGFTDTPLSKLFLDVERANWTVAQACLMSIIDAAQGGEWKAGAYLLDKRFGKYFDQQPRESTRVEMGGEIVDASGIQRGRIFGTVIHTTNEDPTKDLIDVSDIEEV